MCAQLEYNQWFVDESIHTTNGLWTSLFVRFISYVIAGRWDVCKYLAKHKIYILLLEQSKFAKSNKPTQKIMGKH